MIAGLEAEPSNGVRAINFENGRANTRRFHRILPGNQKEGEGDRLARTNVAVSFIVSDGIKPYKTYFDLDHLKTRHSTCSTNGDRRAALTGNGHSSAGCKGESDRSS